MKPELKKKLEAAQKRLADAQALMLKHAAAAAAPGTETKTVTGSTSVDTSNWTMKIDGLEKTVRDLESQVRARPNTTVTTVDATPDKKAFSFARACSKTLEGADIRDSKNWGDAPNELHFLRQGVVERIGCKTWGEAEAILANPAMCKALSLSNTAQLGGIIPTTLMSELIPLNRSNYIVESLGIRIMDGLKGDTEWNRQATGATFYWTGENPGSNFTESDQTLVKVKLSPKEAVGVTRISNRLLNQDPAAVETFVRADLGEGALRAKQTAFFAGTGFGGQPLGILNRTTGSGLAAMNTGSLAGAAGVAIQSIMHLVSLIAEDNNGGTANLKIVMHPNDWFDMCKAVRSEATAAATFAPTGTTAAGAFLPLLSGDASKGAPNLLHGYPVFLTTDMTEGTLLIGDFAQSVLGSWSGMSLAMSDVAENAFLRNQTLVRMLFDMDVAVLQPSAFATGTSLAI